MSEHNLGPIIDLVSFVMVNMGYQVYCWVWIDFIQGNCWALVKVYALLTAILVDNENSSCGKEQ